MNAPHQQGGELLGKKENRGGSETRESGAASWDTVDDLFDKSWVGTAAIQQAARMQWLERELNELRGRVQQQEQGASLGAGPQSTEEPVSHCPMKQSRLHQCRKLGMKRVWMMV